MLIVLHDGDERATDGDGSSLAVGLIDVDDFKKLNDQFGHTTGDAKPWIAALASAGLQCLAWSRKSLRFVTHRHIDDAAVDEAIEIVRKVAPAFQPEEKVRRRA